MPFQCFGNVKIIMQKFDCNETWDPLDSVRIPIFIDIWIVVSHGWMVLIDRIVFVFGSLQRIMSSLINYICIGPLSNEPFSRVSFFCFFQILSYLYIFFCIALCNHAWRPCLINRVPISSLPWYNNSLIFRTNAQVLWLFNYPQIR